MELAENEITLGDFPLGGRLLIRSRKDWRVAVVARKTEEFISISVASPTGYNYRLRRAADIHVSYDGLIPFIHSENTELWRENFSSYDVRW